MLLLDTYSLILLVAEQHNLPARVRDEISRYAGKIFVSAISAYELGLKVNKRLIELPMPAEEWWQKTVEFHGLTEIPVDGLIAIQATQLPQLHNDLAERIIIATALTNNLTIASSSKAILQYPNVVCIWE